MRSPRTAMKGVGGAMWIGLCAAALVSAAAAGPPGAAPNQQQVTRDFLQAHPGVAFSERVDGRLARVYGPAFSQGQTPQQSADRFRDQFAGAWGVTPDELIPVGPFPDGRHTQPIMYQPGTDSYKFTGVYYSQVKQGIPVFRARMMSLVRNEPGYPLVLASADLRDLTGFEVDQALVRGFDANVLRGAVERRLGPGVAVTDPSLVIWAGVDDEPAPPTLAYQYVSVRDQPQRQVWLYVVDAKTGDILYLEDQILHTDVVGNVSGMATDSASLDVCDPVVLRPMPYIRVNIGASQVAFADVNGDFVIPNGGASPVLVEAKVLGQFFDVNHVTGTDATASVTVTPPGPANLVFNQGNPSEQRRAEVNAYIHSNIIRDIVLAHNPTYPAVATQSGFPVNVNINDTCNAFYDPFAITINFFLSSGSCPNTGTGSVVYHEYGHHLVSMAGSGQGAYGEGMGDCMSVIIIDDPVLARGWNYNCATGLRTAANNFQWPCSGEIHFCGNLLSGCIWSTRNELIVTEPSMYLDILRSLTINSILLHTGSSIDPSITIDFLTLDDDNGNISDGTPHYSEIAAGFGAHNMDAPPLALIGFNFPDGLPTLVNPAGGTTVRVEVDPVTGTPEPDTGILHVDTGSGFVPIFMTVVSPNVYDAVFPAVECGLPVDYYFSAQATNGVVQTFPAGAPADVLQAISATSLADTFDDNFETDQGWTVTNSGGLTDGPWERGVPAGGNVVPGDRGDPPADGDGSGQCYVTDNAPGNSDVDDGTTTLTSPIMDASQGPSFISYYRWYSNDFGNAPESDIFVVEVSDNGGASWVNLETVGPAGAEVHGGWYFKQFALASIPGFQQNNQFRIRFQASDLGAGSVVEAGVDGVKLTAAGCGVTGDLNGDGVIDVLDLLLLLGDWGPCAGCPADLNGDNVVDVLDLLELLAGWS